MTGLLGYGHPAYAEVYSAYGEPFRLPATGGSVLLRAISGSERRDAMGCYPVFCCEDWSGLAADLGLLARDCISLVLVSDPFADIDPSRLGRLFEWLHPFKTHYVADLDQPIETYVGAGRLRYARKVLRRLEFDVPKDPLRHVEDWLRLQDQSRHREHLTGINRLSEDETARLFSVPGAVLLRVAHQGETVGLHLAFHQGDVVFQHISAYDPEGFRLGASTAIYLCSLELFAGRARWMDWGGVPGGRDVESGLSLFKQEFSNVTRTAYLCGTIFDREAYAALSARRPGPPTSYFPAYRRNELV